MTGCFRTCVRKQPIVALYIEFENELKVYNLEAIFQLYKSEMLVLADLDNQKPMTTVDVLYGDVCI